MDKSIFDNKDSIPSFEDVSEALGTTASLWFEIIQLVQSIYPEVIEEWNFSGQKYGWSFRLKDKKRVLIYLLPRAKIFKVAFVFGQKATDFILKSSISAPIKTELEAAKVYAEGRGIRIDVTDKAILSEIKKLIEIKISV